MANEVSYRHTATGSTLYFTIRNVSRQMWNTAGTPTLETLTVANWTSYDVAMTESPASSYFYAGTFPAVSGNMVVGWYWVDIYSQAGGSPAIGDSLVASFFGYWDGTTYKFWGDDVIQLAGTGQTGRDIGASVLLSAGTGAGQLDFTSGVVKSSLVQILGTAITETAGQIAAAFKQFFDVPSPTGTMQYITRVALVDTTTVNTDMRGTDSAATASALATAQADLDILTGTNGATLATSQPNYAPLKAGDYRDPRIVAGAITGVAGAPWSYLTNLTIPINGKYPCALFVCTQAGNNFKESVSIETVDATGEVFLHDVFPDPLQIGDTFEIWIDHEHSEEEIAGETVTQLTNLQTSSAQVAGSLFKLIGDGATNTSTLLSRIPAALFAGITSLGDWLRRAFRGDAGTAGMIAAQAEINTGGTSTFDGTTDNLEDIAAAGGGAGGEVTLTDAQETELVTLIAAQLGGVRVKASPVPYNGGPRTLVRGDDYNGDFEIPWQILDAGAIAALTGKTVSMQVIIVQNGQEHSAASGAGTIDVATGDTRSGTVPWADLAADVPKGEGRYEFVFTDGDGARALIVGPLKLI